MERLISLRRVAVRVAFCFLVSQCSGGRPFCRRSRASVYSLWLPLSSPILVPRTVVTVRGVTAALHGLPPPAAGIWTSWSLCAYSELWPGTAPRTGESGICLTSLAQLPTQAWRVLAALFASAIEIGLRFCVLRDSFPPK